MKAAIAITIGSLLVLVALGLQGSESQAPKIESQAPKNEAQAPGEPEVGGAQAFECRWRAGEIELDGTINERSWLKAAPVELQVPWQKRKSNTSTTARLLWDWDYLYFCAEMVDHDLYADVTEVNGPVEDNDSFGLLLKPSATSLPYYQFMVSAGSTPLEVFFPSRGAGGSRRFAPQTELTFEGVVKINGTLNDWTDKDIGWTVEARIPWTTFKPTGGRPANGDRWRFAFVRHDYSATLDQPELSTNAPLTRPDMHRYEEYQELVFVQKI